MKQFFIKLYEAFDNASADFQEAGCKPIAFIERYRGQPLEPEQHEYYDLPALFIGRSTVWEDNKNGVSAFDFHLVTEPTWDTNNIAPKRLEGLEYFDLVEQMRKVLDGFQTEFNSGLKRTIDREVDTGVVIYEVFGYSCAFYEGEDEDKYNYTDGDGDVSVDGHLKKKF